MSNPSTRPTKNRHRGLGAILRRSLILVWPDNCPLCGRPLRYGEKPLCLACLMALPRLHADEMMAHVGAPRNLIEVKSWFVYDTSDPSHTLIHDIKYRDRRKLAVNLGREFAAQKLSGANDIEVILPIPLHPVKYLLRGYNQTREIARGINDITGIRIGDHLQAIRSHSSQTQKNREERARNVEGIFAVRHPEQLNCKHIALLDDVITTGATMHSALDTILRVAKPASVTFLSLARTAHR